MAKRKSTSRDQAPPEPRARRCKVGDLAIIIRDGGYPGHTRNIGKIVEVIGHSSIADWLVEARGTPLWGTELHQTFTHSHMLDEHLKPLPGSSSEVDQNDFAPLTRKVEGVIAELKEPS